MSTKSAQKRFLIAAARPRAVMFVMAIALLGTWSAECSAGGGPENVAVIVNGDSASSKLIANHYIRLRKIPARNVIFLTGIPDREKTDLDTFKTKILAPILKQLELRQIRHSVDYIVYSADFPTSISILRHKNLLFDEIRKRSGAPKDRQVRSSYLYKSYASINALTYFATAVLSDEPGYIRLDANSYYRVPARQILASPFIGQQQQEYQAAIKTFDQQSGEAFEHAIATLEKLVKANPGQAAVSYWLAKFYAVRGDIDLSIKWLTDAVQNGWNFREQTKQEKAFETVRRNPLFRGLEDNIPDEPFTFAPTRGFKHQRRWAINGMLNGEDGQGNRFFLSTVLAVTRNLGTTEQEALDQLQASIGADESKPEGAFYFSLGKGVRNATRKSQIKPVVEALKAMGKKAVTLKSDLPDDASDICGLLTGTSKFDFASSGSKIVPGAICEHLTSYGGRLSVPTQTKLSEFIRYGAAGSSGTVTEPHAVAAKFPHAMIHVHYARGCSLAESFYQSVAGPFQLLIVGDALCQPYATRPKVKVDGIEPNQKVSTKVKLNFDVSESKVPVSRVEVYVDGVLFYRNHELDALNFDASLLSDGYHEMRVVVTANDLIESSGRQIIPFTANNNERSVQVRCDKENWQQSENVIIEVSSNFGASFSVVQNMRSVAPAQQMKDDKRPLRFKIPAQLLGRGPVELQAVVTDEENAYAISSAPIYLDIEGPIATTKRNTERPKRTRPKAASSASNGTSQWTLRNPSIDQGS
jgi:tetratricopeptide (TPR) repeat protein